jgi:hypothetical protein
MRLALPSLDRIGHGLGRGAGQILSFAPRLARLASLHDDLYRAADADEKNGQSVETARAVEEDAPRGWIRGVVA